MVKMSNILKTVMKNISDTKESYSTDIHSVKPVLKLRCVGVFSMLKPGTVASGIAIG